MPACIHPTMILHALSRTTRDGFCLSISMYDGMKRTSYLETCVLSSCLQSKSQSGAKKSQNACGTQRPVGLPKTDGENSFLQSIKQVVGRPVTVDVTVNTTCGSADRKVAAKVATSIQLKNQTAPTAFQKSVSSDSTDAVAMLPAF